MYSGKGHAVACLISCIVPKPLLIGAGKYPPIIIIQQGRFPHKQDFLTVQVCILTQDYALPYILLCPAVKIPPCSSLPSIEHKSTL